MGHATFYGTCVGLIVAVLVVLYFGEKVIPANQHGPAAIYLGVIIGVILLIPVSVLGGFMPDTYRNRLIVAGTTLLFLFAASNVVVRNWGLEDGQRRREASRPRPAPVWDISALLPSPEKPASGLTERERAAQVFGAALTVARQFTPEITSKLIGSGQLQVEVNRQAQVGKQWMQVEPALIAVAAGFPSEAVRSQVAVFNVACINLMKRCHELVDVAGGDLSDEVRAERAKATEDAAQDALATLGAEWETLITALHADEPGTPKPRARTKAPHGSRTGSGT